MMIYLYIRPSILLTPILGQNNFLRITFLRKCNQRDVVQESAIIICNVVGKLMIPEIVSKVTSGRERGGGGVKIVNAELRERELTNVRLFNVCLRWYIFICIQKTNSM